MSRFKTVFCRQEVKYILSERQLSGLADVLEGKVVADAFANSEIINLYYDTPDFLLVRRSLEKPAYKEKLRLRCYGTPQTDTQAFVEIKKKYDGTVYKRRASLPYGQALAYLAGKDPGGEGQIFQELDWVLRFYQRLIPAMVLSYQRASFQGKEDEGLRMTFDRNILWRAEELDLADGPWGEPLLQKGQCLMELKIPGAMPLWLSAALSELGIYPASFSKYGKAYETYLRHGAPQRGVRQYA